MTTICNSCQTELDNEFENKVKNGEFTLKGKNTGMNSITQTFQMIG